MSNPLDDALRELNVADAHRRTEQADKEKIAAEQRQKFQALVDDFLRRMHAAGDPGTDWSMREGLFRRVRGWGLPYVAGESHRNLLLRVDGLMPDLGTEEFRWVRPVDCRMAFGDKILKQLAGGMAEIMHRHGVS